MNKIYERGDPIALITSRLSPSEKDKEDEKFVFIDLDLSILAETNEYKITKNKNINLITYTNGYLKGPYVKKIVESYKKLGYTNFIYCDDRIDQISSILEINPEIQCFLIKG